MTALLIGGPGHGRVRVGCAGGDVVDGRPRGRVSARAVPGTCGFRQILLMKIIFSKLRYERQPKREQSRMSTGPRRLDS